MSAEPTYSDYLSSIVGSTVVAVSEDEGYVRLHMSDGHAMEVTAMAGGFAITVILPAEMH